MCHGPGWPASGRDRNLENLPMPRSGTSTLPSKPCAVCGRAFTWRKKWERDWEHVRYCSDACRRRGVKPADARLERAILELLRARSAGSTICPSEAARACDPEAWRDLLDAARASARRLADQGVIEITQRGTPVDPSTARGPIRLRLTRR